MKGLLPDKEIQNPQAKVPWTRLEFDKALDRYFEGCHPDQIGIEMKKGPRAFTKLIEKYTYNIEGRAERYRPVRRISRKGKRWTQNEIKFVEAHLKKEVKPKITALLLARSVKEITGDKVKGVAESNWMKGIAPTLDLIWAHRYIHFVYKTPVVTDQAYDELVREEIEFGGGEKSFGKIKNHKGWPEHIKSLALYLVEREKLK